MKKSGIYKITNIVNGHFYIGSAIDISKRWSRHKSLLKRGIHHNIHLQRSYNKIPSKFIYEIIEICDSNCLILREQYYLDLLNPVYNIARIAYSSLGIIRKQETKDKLRAINIGKKLSVDVKHKISQSNTGKKRTPEQRNKLSILKLGNKNPIFKYGWDKQIKAMQIANTGKKRSRETVQKISKKLSKPVIQLSLDNIFIKEWESATQIEKTLGFKNGDINAVCKGTIQKGWARKTAYKFKWKFKQDYDNQTNNS